MSAYFPVNYSSDYSFVFLLLMGKQNTVCYFFLFFYETLFSQSLLTFDPGHLVNQATHKRCLSLHPRVNKLTKLKFMTDSF